MLQVSLSTQAEVTRVKSVFVPSPVSRATELSNPSRC